MATDFYTNEDGFIQYTATEDQTRFDFDWYTDEASQIKTYLGDMEINESTVWINPNKQGGYVTLAPQPADTIITIRREQESKRVTNFTATGYITADLLNKEFDNLARTTGQVQHSVERSLHLSEYESQSIDCTLPTPEANKSVRWNSQGDALESVEFLTFDDYSTSIDRILEAEESCEEDALISATNAMTSIINAQLAQDAADSVVFPIPVGDGLWVEGKTFNEYPEYMVYNEIRYTPIIGTALPYTVGATPDLTKVKVVGEINAVNVVTASGETLQDFIDSFTLKIFQSPTNGGLTEIQTRTVSAGEVYEVRKVSDDSLATIYSDAAGTTEIMQNGTDNKSGSDGVVEFYIADGDYYVEVNDVSSGFFVSSNYAQMDARWYGLSAARLDNQIPIQAMIDDVGYFVLPAGQFNINDSILYRGSTKSLGSKWSGAGKETSILNCVNMAGKSAIDVDGDVYVRVELADFKVQGFCDHAISFMQANRETFQTKFTRLRLLSGSDTIRVSKPFSVEFDHVDADSNNGHCFYTRGGNTVQFSNCYAHSVGAGKAGYRILGRAVLISCNGIDETSGDQYWGWFGDVVTNQAYQITTINCNSEDFGSQGAIRCENFGNLVLNGHSFLPRSTGTYDSILHFPTSGNNRVNIDSMTSVSSKGATLSGESNIKAAGLSFGLNMSTSFTNYRNTSANLTYPLPTISMVGSGFGVSSMSVNNFAAESDYSYETPLVKTWPANTTIFDGTGVKSVKTSNTVSTSITNMTGLREGTTMHLLIKDSFTTIRHSVGGVGRFILTGGSDVVTSNGQVYTFVANGVEWVQI